MQKNKKLEKRILEIKPETLEVLKQARADIFTESEINKAEEFIENANQ